MTDEINSGFINRQTRNQNIKKIFYGMAVALSIIQGKE